MISKEGSVLHHLAFLTAFTISKFRKAAKESFGRKETIITESVTDNLTISTNGSVLRANDKSQNNNFLTNVT